MTWSFRIGRFFGIDVFVHATFLLLPLWYVIETYYRTRSWWAALDQLVFVLLVFTIIVMHEYGHALTARLFGVKTKDIILLPIGGVARLESIPQKPWQELLIAAAGPAVNVVLAQLCMIWFVLDGGFAAFIQEILTPNVVRDPVKAILDTPMSGRLLEANILLIIFNLIPAFPMDGGRILRAILAMGLDYVKATWIAARIGQAAAILFVIWGFLPSGSPMLFLIAVMIWTGAMQEARFTALRASLSGLTARQAMTSQFLTLYPFDTLETASQKLLMTSQLAFPVLHGDALVGMISRSEIGSSLANLGPGRHVSEVMRREAPIARPEDLLLNLLPLLQRGLGALPVVEGDQLVGLLTMNEVAARLQRAGA
jgi:Zn-dependent protease/predicted transcriptional regulator